MSLDHFFKAMKVSAYELKTEPQPEPWQQVLGLSQQDDVKFTRNETTGLFDDQKMVGQLLKAMDDPIWERLLVYLRLSVFRKRFDVNCLPPFLKPTLVQGTFRGASEASRF